MPKNKIEQFASDSPLIHEIRQLKADLRAGRYTQPATVLISQTGEADFTINNNDWSTVALTLTSTDQQTLPNIPPEITLYKTQSYTSADIYPSGVNWTSSEIYNFFFESFSQRALAAPEQLYTIVKLRNDTGGSLDMRITVSWRYYNVGSN